MEKHYICLGGCKGVSKAPGVCQAPDCVNHNHNLVECDCVDGLHNGFKKKSNIFKKIFKIILYIIFIPIVTVGIIGAYFEIDAHGLSLGKHDFSGTLGQIILRGGSYYCEFSERGSPEIDIPGHNGNIYIAGEKAKSYINNHAGMMPVVREDYTVRDGENLYKWSFTKSPYPEIAQPGYSTIVKSKFDKFEANNLFNKYKAGWNLDGTQKYINLPKQKYNFQCKKWKPDYSVFELPKDLELVEIMPEPVSTNTTPIKVLPTAQCIKEKGAVLYGTSDCEYCDKQKSMFKTTADQLPYVDCSTPDGKGQAQICTDNKIISYPTWTFSDGTSRGGLMSLSQLIEKTGCPMNIGN